MVDSQSLDVAGGTPSPDAQPQNTHADVDVLEGAARRLSEVVGGMDTHAVEEQSRAVVESSQLAVGDGDSHEVEGKHSEVAEREAVGVLELVEVALVEVHGVQEVAHAGEDGLEVAGLVVSVGCKRAELEQRTQDAAMMYHTQVHAAHAEEVPQAVALRRYDSALRCAHQVVVRHIQQVQESQQVQVHCKLQEVHHMQQAVARRMQQVLHRTQRVVAHRTQLVLVHHTQQVLVRCAHD